MTVRALSPGETVATLPDVPVVCILCSGEHGPASETLVDVLRHTPPRVPVLLGGTDGPDLERVQAELATQTGLAQGREILALAVGCKDSFAQTANAVSAATGGDLVLVAPGVRVGPEWLERLSAAAYCDSTVVSATALGENAGSLSVAGEASLAQRAPDPQKSGQEMLEPETQGNGAQPMAALAVIARSPRAYPRIASAGAHCVYLRRTLLDRLGGFDVGIHNPAEAVTELSLRALALGMLHVAADDVLVTCQAPPDLVDHHQQRPAGDDHSELAADDPSQLPAVHDCAAPTAGDWQDERTVLRRSLACAHAALHGLSVTIDARALGPSVGGTQRYTSELILALAAADKLRLRVVVPPDLPPVIASRLEAKRTLEIVTYAEAVAGVEPSDIVHRPQQVFTADDLALLRLLGERIVIGQQDLIAYRLPTYHESAAAWRCYRRVTRIALTVADRVVFFSEHAMRDAVGEELVPAGLCDVAGIGADALGSPPAAPAPAIPPEPVVGVSGDRDLLLCLGADYSHKNRPFAIVLHRALRDRHGWDGHLVLAGEHVPHGSSREEERTLLAESPDLAGSVIDVGAVGEAQRMWLYERARAVVYPTLYEGFGLLPFEAARAGIPCLFAPQASLVELAGPAAATLVPWDAQRSADAVAALLMEGPERERHLQLLLDGAAQSRWVDVVGRLIETYERVMHTPYRAAAPRAWQELERERLIVELDRELSDLRGVRDSAGALAGPEHGGLLTESERRGLMRIATRPLLRRMMLGPISVLGRRW